MDRAVVIAALVAGGAFVLHAQSAGAAPAAPPASAQNAATGTAGSALNLWGVLGLGGFPQSTQPAAGASGWQPPPAAYPYLAQIQAASQTYGLPKNLLARVLQQESNYNPNAVSPAGAQGIAQLMPASFPDTNPFDPIASIDAAAHYLAQLHSRFGSWTKALAAYNWGPGNLSRYGIGAEPAQTRNYVNAITADVPVS